MVSVSCYKATFKIIILPSKYSREIRVKIVFLKGTLIASHCRNGKVQPSLASFPFPFFTENELF